MDGALLRSHGANFSLHDLGKRESQAGVERRFNNKSSLELAHFLPEET